MVEEPVGLSPLQAGSHRGQSQLPMRGLDYQLDTTYPGLGQAGLIKDISRRDTTALRNVRP